MAVRKTIKIDKELIKRVANNARLNLTDKEIEEFIPQFKDILNVFSKISEVNTDNVKVSIHPIEIKNSMREDIPEKCITQEDALKNTKHKKDGYFKGPAAI